MKSNMPYVESVCVAGKTVEIERYYTARYGKRGQKRGTRVKPSKEEQRAINNRQAEKKLRRILNANFSPGDFHLVLSYDHPKGTPARAKEEMKEDILDLGFLPVQDKYDAYAAASIFCNPSANESFSLVIMESWLCETPVLVNEKCAVTKNFACEAAGGLYFKDYADFEGAVNYLLDNEEIANTMAKNGKKYVQTNFAWDTIVEKYYNFFEEIAEKEILKNMHRVY